MFRRNKTKKQKEIQLLSEQNEQNQANASYLMEVVRQLEESHRETLTSYKLNVDTLTSSHTDLIRQNCALNQECNTLKWEVNNMRRETRRLKKYVRHLEQSMHTDRMQSVHTVTSPRGITNTTYGHGFDSDTLVESIRRQDVRMKFNDDPVRKTRRHRHRSRHHNKPIEDKKPLEDKTPSKMDSSNVEAISSPRGVTGSDSNSEPPLERTLIPTQEKSKIMSQFVSSIIDTEQWAKMQKMQKKNNMDDKSPNSNSKLPFDNGDDVY